LHLRSKSEKSKKGKNKHQAKNKQQKQDARRARDGECASEMAGRRKEMCQSEKFERTQAQFANCISPALALLLSLPLSVTL